MNIYIDSDYKCHAADDGTMREVEVPDFEGKCKAYIEGRRFVPEGETWMRSDGVQFVGKMIAPFEDSRILDAYQAQYEAMLPEIQVRESALAIVGVTSDD